MSVDALEKLILGNFALVIGMILGLVITIAVEGIIGWPTETIIPVNDCYSILYCDCQLR